MGTRRAVSPLLLMLRHQSFQVARLHLPAGHDPLDRWQPEDGAEQGGNDFRGTSNIVTGRGPANDCIKASRQVSS